MASYSALPSPKTITPYIGIVGETRWFELVGSGFDTVTDVYLSGCPLAESSIVYDPFGPSSQKHPSFFAVKLSACEWKYIKEDSTIIFALPQTLKTGFVDVIIENSIGYSSLVENVRVNTYENNSSFPPPAFSPYQFPFSNGIQILDPRDVTYVPVVSGFLLLETTTDYLLQENMDKIILDFVISNC